jgi:hypothetical protein
MRQFVIISAGLLIMAISNSCNGQATSKETINNDISSVVNVYYFHFTRRCSTCLAVEENARKAVESLYADKVKAGEYSFSAINLDDEASREIAKRLNVGGQTLLVVRGDRKIDITDKGFMNAHNPEKMKEEIKAAVDKVLF